MGRMSMTPECARRHTSTRAVPNIQGRRRCTYAAQLLLIGRRTRGKRQRARSPTMPSTGNIPDDREGRMQLTNFGRTMQAATRIDWCGAIHASRAARAVAPKPKGFGA